MNWTSRTLEDVLLTQANSLDLFPVWLLLGPRQVGKSSLLKRLASQNRTLLTLDDLDSRIRANRDPKLFLQSVKLPILIDEIQYAPDLLSEIKIRVDTGALSAGSVWLTGSQNFSVMNNVRESLAGRVAILNLFGFSDAEKKPHAKTDSAFDSMLESSFPKIFGEKNPETLSNYLNAYVQTYVEKDVMELGGIVKRREFEIFVKMCALRTGQIVDVASLARDAGVSPNTAKEWLGVLEDSFLIRLVPPYHSNRNKRLIKSPKLYFLDAGLCAHLAGWSTRDQLAFGPMAGAFFETHVFGQILRFFAHHYRSAKIHFWRTKDGDEIDFLVETKERTIPIEVKLSPHRIDKLTPLEKFREDRWENGVVISTRSGTSPQKGWDRVESLDNLGGVLD